MSDLMESNIAKGYLNFLQSLTGPQQKSEVQRIVFSESQGLIAKKMLEHPTVVAFNQSLGFDPHWRFKTTHSEMGADEIGSPSFSENLCIVPILFSYDNIQHSIGSIVSNLEYKLFVNGLVYIDDNAEPMIGTVTCWSNQTEVDAQKAEFAELQEHSYLNYLRVLTPSNRPSAIFDLACLTWGTDDPKFLTYPQLNAAAKSLGIAHLSHADLTVGPVEFEGDHCKVPITYELYGYLHGKDELIAAKSIDDEILDAKYFVQIQILASVSDTVSASTSDIGCELSIGNMWFSIVPIEDYEQKNLMIVS